MKKATPKLVLRRETLKTIGELDLSRVVGGEAASRPAGTCVVEGGVVKEQAEP